MLLSYVFVFLATLAATVALETAFIPRLRKRAAQPIYEDGPAWHKAKLGTPTMGGACFLISTVFTLLPASVLLLKHGHGESLASFALIIAFAVLNSLIGIIDDLTKIRKKENAGLSAGGKLLLQSITVALFIAARYFLVDKSTGLDFSFGTVELGSFYYPLTALALLGGINCANLTDGIDGLAASVAFAASVALFYIGSAVSEEISLIASAVIGATVGFLFFNAHPAKVFMGDTGSLFLGAIISACAVSLGNPLLIALLGSVYVIEGASVIIQVASFKLTGKRVFKMAPLHHHLEKSGFCENTIVIIAIVFTLISSIFAVYLYL